MAYCMFIFWKTTQGAFLPAIKGIWRSWKLFPHALRERRSIQKSRVVDIPYIKSIIRPNLPDKNIKRIKNMFIPGSAQDIVE